MRSHRTIEAPSHRTLATGAVLLLSVAATAQSGSLTTTFSGTDIFAGGMFALIAKADITLTGFDVHFEDDLNPAPCGVFCSVTEVNVYYREGGWKNHTNTESSWTLIGAVQHTVSTGQGVPQPLNLALGLDMDPLTRPKLSFYVTNSGFSNSLTGAPNEMIRMSHGKAEFSTPELTFKSGAANEFIWINTFEPKTWNGTVYYDCASSGTVYCTAGTSASGCQAGITTSGAASASAPSGFHLMAASVEGAKDGLFFFGANGQQANPWGNGTSFQCVVPPVKRGGLLTGVGTSGQCDGAFSQDLNALWTAAPPKNPGAGAVVQAQLWHRDPFNTSNQTTGLSNAVEFTVCP